ncbi:MAG TPA: hypothetical protein VGK99_24020 [Acidobacteriota bacterium]|jgi:hypothetical protein
MNDPPSDKIKLRYLAGELSEEEKLRLEAQYFSDEAAYEELRAFEDELIYDYLRGGLREEERRIVEARVLATPEGRRRLQLAQALMLKLSPGPASATEGHSAAVSRITTTKGTIFTFSRWRGSHYLALAAMLLLFVASIWLLVRKLQPLPDSSGVAQQPNGIPNLAGSHVRPPPPMPQPDQSQTRRPPIGPPGSRASVSSSLTIALAPGMARGGGEPNRVKIPAGTEKLTFVLGIPRGRVYGAYRVTLETAEGREIFHRNNIRPRSSAASEAVVSLTVPAGGLRTGDYLFLLHGIGTAGAAEEVADYTVTILVNQPPIYAK